MDPIQPPQSESQARTPGPRPRGLLSLPFSFPGVSPYQPLLRRHKAESRGKRNRYSVWLYQDAL